MITLLALLWIKEEIAERMAAEFQGDLTHESILQALDSNKELAGDEKSLAAPGIALLLFVVHSFGSQFDGQYEFLAFHFNCKPGGCCCWYSRNEQATCHSYSIHILASVFGTV